MHSLASGSVAARLLFSTLPLERCIHNGSDATRAAAVCCMPKAAQAAGRSKPAGAADIHCSAQGAPPNVLTGRQQEQGGWRHTWQSPGWPPACRSSRPWGPTPWRPRTPRPHPRRRPSARAARDRAGAEHAVGSAYGRACRPRPLAHAAGQLGVVPQPPACPAPPPKCPTRSSLQIEQAKVCMALARPPTRPAHLDVWHHQAALPALAQDLGEHLQGGAGCGGATAQWPSLAALLLPPF